VNVALKWVDEQVGTLTDQAVDGMKIAM